MWLVCSTNIVLGSCLCFFSLALNLVPAILTFTLWRSYRSGTYWVYVGVPGARRASAPFAYWCAMILHLMLLLAASAFAGYLDVIALQARGWL